MINKGTQFLETERLILRPFTMDDVSNMYKNWASEDEVTKYLTWPTHASEDVTKTIISSWVESYQFDNFYQWAIVLKSINEPIGSISVVEMDESIERAEVGYCIGKNWWKQGITSEALNAIIEYLFNEVQLNCIYSRHATDNPNSGKVMKKCGLQYEGTLRKSARSNQGIQDMAHYSILKEDFNPKKD